jgi:hypothetical protein
VSGLTHKKYVRTFHKVDITIEIPDLDLALGGRIAQYCMHATDFYQEVILDGFNPCLFF